MTPEQAVVALAKAKAEHLHTRETLEALKRQHEQLRAEIERILEGHTEEGKVWHWYALRAALDATPAELDKRQCENTTHEQLRAAALRAALDATPAGPQTDPLSKQASEPICYECKNSADQRFCKFCS